MAEYRIVTDAYNGYEVQSRRWWWPFWVQGKINSHTSVEAAEKYAKTIAKREVAYLGRYPS